MFVSKHVLIEYILDFKKKSIIIYLIYIVEEKKTAEHSLHYEVQNRYCYIQSPK